MAEKPQSPNPEQPVAYDAQGRPLYTRPQSPVDDPQAVAPQVVYMARPHEPVKPELSDEVLKRHKDSVRQYPLLNLSDGEYVVSAIRRHPIGILTIWGGIGIIIAMLLGFLGIVVANQESISATGDTSMLGLFLLGLTVLFFIIGVIATIIYNGNRFFLTNESVIQHIQTGLFSTKMQTISLVNIEDASFRQHGFIQHLLGYGSLRLSTEGDETTYRFSFVSNPQHQLNLLNDAVEAFKNGRPLDAGDTTNENT
jgi:Bacterial PH domain